MSVGHESGFQNDVEEQEPELDRTFDPEILAINRAVKLIKKLSPDAKAYVLARCKQP